MTAQRHLLKVLSLGAMCAILTVTPALAQQQLRFSVKPAASDPAWATAGVTFEKSGSCAYSTSATPSTTWPVPAAALAGSGTARAPLFNPGQLKPNGTYDRTVADDGFNTLLIPMTVTGGGQTMVCHGAILANGIDVTRDPIRQDAATVAQSLGQIATNGPMTVSPVLDPAKLAKVAAPKPAVAFAGHTIYRQGTYVVTTKGAIDLDSGTLSPDWDEKSDVVVILNMIGLPDPLIRAQQDAHMSGLEKGHRTYAGCAAAQYLPSAAQSDRLSPIVDMGSSRCIITDEGRYAELFVANSTSKPDGTHTIWTVTFTYVVWDK